MFNFLIEGIDNDGESEDAMNGDKEVGSLLNTSVLNWINDGTAHRITISEVTKIRDGKVESEDNWRIK